MSERTSAILVVIIALTAFVASYVLTSKWVEGPGASEPVVQLDDAVYPFYDGATWNEPTATTSTDYGPAIIVQSVPVTNTMNIAQVSTPFTAYYHDKLTQAGWMQDMSREAGGPGAEVSFYTKGDQFIIVYFHSDFHVRPENAPVQCPCDVYLTLMSGTSASTTSAR